MQRWWKAGLLLAFGLFLGLIRGSFVRADNWWSNFHCDVPVTTYTCGQDREGKAKCDSRTDYYQCDIPAKVGPEDCGKTFSGETGYINNTSCSIDTENNRCTFPKPVKIRCSCTAPACPTATPAPHCNNASCEKTETIYGRCGGGSCSSTQRRVGIRKRYKYDPNTKQCLWNQFCYNVSDVCENDCDCGASTDANGRPCATPTPTFTPTPTPTPKKDTVAPNVVSPSCRVQTSVDSNNIRSGSLSFNWSWPGDNTCSGCEGPVGYCINPDADNSTCSGSCYSAYNDNNPSGDACDAQPFWWQIRKTSTQTTIAEGNNGNTSYRLDCTGRWGEEYKVRVKATDARGNQQGRWGKCTATCPLLNCGESP